MALCDEHETHRKLHREQGSIRKINGFDVQVILLVSNSKIAIVIFLNFCIFKKYINELK